MRFIFTFGLLYILAAFCGCASEPAPDSGTGPGSDGFVQEVDSGSETGKEDIWVADVAVVDIQGAELDAVVGPVDANILPEDGIEDDLFVGDIGGLEEDTAVAMPVELPEGLIGTPVDTPTLPPQITAVVDSDGNPVDSSDLLGSPTILWFFPLPSTPG